MSAGGEAVRAEEVRQRLRLLGVDDALVAGAESQLAAALARALASGGSEPALRAEGSPPRVFYLLCITPRSGSTVLADWLTSVGGCRARG